MHIFDYNTYYNRNIQGISTKIDEVFQQLEKYDIDIAVISETKRKGKGNEVNGNYILFYSRVDKDQRVEAGIGIAVHKKLTGKIKIWEEVDERLLKMELEVYGHNIVLLGIYAPNNELIIT